MEEEFYEWLESNLRESHDRDEYLEMTFKTAPVIVASMTAKIAEFLGNTDGVVTVTLGGEVKYKGKKLSEAIRIFQEL